MHTNSMDFRFTPEQEALRQEVRTFLESELPSGWRGFGGFGEPLPTSEEEWIFLRRFMRRMGNKGWLAICWPRQYGGQERSLFDQLILIEELGYYRAPYLGVGVTMAAPTVLAYGSEDQKRKWVTPLGKGELVFCEGFSEPGAGSDLASCQTRAVEEKDHFIIQGQKLYTSGAQHSDFCWLLARTDAAATKHRGLSLFVVDMKTAGITVRPLMDMLGHCHFYEVFFDDVYVPRDALVGAKNEGWRQAMMTLDFERAVFRGGADRCRRILEELVAYTREASGDALAKKPILRHRLAELALEVEISRLLAYRTVYKLERHEPASIEASIAKLFCTELLQRIANVGMQILGLYGQLRPESKWAALGGMIERLYLFTVSETIGAGTSETIRDIIAKGLGLPRSR